MANLTFSPTVNLTEGRTFLRRNTALLEPAAPDPAPDITVTTPEAPEVRPLTVEPTPDVDPADVLDLGLTKSLTSPETVSEV